VTNGDMAAVLEQVAELLEYQGASPFRVTAWKRASEKVQALDEPVDTVLQRGGMAELERVLGVGQALASVLRELSGTGRLRMLERLKGQVSPEDLFVTVPGVGPALAQRAHRLLHLDTLEELELAAHDGRLAKVPGFGPRRALMVRQALASMLAHSMRRRGRAVPGAEGPAKQPPVALLLSVDNEYREKAGRGELRAIAPKRFNPEHQAWLPVLHAERGEWSFTALYSNTARAHELGRTHDWVVIYWEHDGDEGQCTVVTESKGPYSGHRVVRGREPETPIERRGEA